MRSCLTNKTTALKSKQKIMKMFASKILRFYINRFSSNEAHGNQIMCPFY